MPEAGLMDVAMTQAEARAGKDRRSLAALKRDLHTPALAARATLDA